MQMLNSVLSSPCVACKQGHHEKALCRACASTIGTPSHQDLVIAAYPYLDAAKAALSHWKQSSATWIDARLVAEATERVLPELRAFKFDLVVVVPPSPLRVFVRGFHPPDVWACHLAVATQTRFVPRALWRIDLGQQRGATRKDRLRDAPRFVMSPLALRQVRGKQVLLVDDVFTTGSTLRHAEAMLRIAAVDVVAKVVLARVP